MLQFQRLCGSLNFLCKCILPGRTFLRRLYAATSSNARLRQHHHVKITSEHRMDLMTWEFFLRHPTVYSRPFICTGIADAVELDIFSDASCNFKAGGFGTYCGSEWSFGQWDEQFCSIKQPSIEYLELFGVTVAVLNWLKLFKNRRIVLFCDNQAVVNMINNTTSSCKNCMILIRMIILESLVVNTRVYAKFVRSKDNGKADALSHLQFDRFRKLSNGLMNRLPTLPPSVIWPMSKIWVDNLL